MTKPLYVIGNSDDFFKRIRQEVKAEITSSFKHLIKNNGEENETVYIKMDEVSRLLHLSRPAIYERIKEGKITLYKEGRNSFFDKEEIMNLINPSSTNKNK